VRKKVCRGDSTLFWEDQWVDNQPLRQKFPRLFGISNQKQEVIQNMGSVIEGRWHWDLSWRRNRFEWEEEQFRNLCDVISSFFPGTVDDSWTWLGDGVQGFTVKGAYLLLESSVVHSRQVTQVEEVVFKRLWKGLSPSKVRAFVWQLLLGRIPTKDNLFKRRMIPMEQVQCVFCNRCLETSLHLFLHCDVVHQIWCDITRWLGLVLIVPNSLTVSFAMWSFSSKNKKEKEGIVLIWNVYLWVLWKARNDFVFNNKNIVRDDIVEEIKIISWQWFIGRAAKNPCLLYEWKWGPRDCMRR
jgi:hypothetical protein